MADPKPVVSAHHGSPAVAPERAAAWSRVSRMFAFACAIVSGGALYQNGGLPAWSAAAAAVYTGLATLVVLRIVGAARGLGSLAAFSGGRHRKRIALGFGVLTAALGGAGVYVHDGAPLKDALLQAAILGVTGFIAGYLLLPRAARP